MQALAPRARVALAPSTVRGLMATEGNGGVGTGWIPIREEASPDVPFDLVSQRTVLVRRSQDGQLNKKAFAKELRAKLSALLDN